MTGRPGPTGPEELIARFAECVAVGDVDGLTRLYAADAVVSLRDGREAAGSSQIREVFVAALALRLDLAVELVGRPIVCRGVACLSTRGADGQVCTQVAREEPDGSWRLLRDGFRFRELDAEEVMRLGRDVA